MTVVRRQGEHTIANPQRATRRIAAHAAALGMLAVLGLASSASAVILTGGPSTSLPGGGSCTPSGITTVGTGATLTCTGLNIAAHTKVYIALRVDAFPIGNTMTGADPGASSSQVWRFSTSGATSITYTSSTQADSAIPAFGSGTAASTLLINRTVGTGSVVAAGGNPANSPANGDVGALFLATSASQTFDVDVTATRTGPGSGQASTVYDILHGTAGGGGERSRVNVAFYWSDCGDGQVDSPEQCDAGLANGTAGSCCSSTCTFKSNGTACTDDGNQCTDDQCNGASAACLHPNKSSGSSCTDSIFCNGPDQCNGAGACTLHSGDPCSGPDGDGNCSESCNEAADNCTAADPLGSACTDGIFCNGTDTCSGGACVDHSGDPCPGADGDTNCSETCNEAGDNCAGADPDGSSCRPAAGICDQAETCSSGSCPSDAVKLSGTVCNAGSGDLCDPDEVCDGVVVTCPSDTITPGGTLCRGGSGDSCDPDETCTGAANAPCPADIVASNSTVCRTGSGDSCDPDETCTGSAGQPCPSDTVEPSSTVCRPGSGDDCDPDEFCPGVAAGTCAAQVIEPNTTVCRPGSGDLCDPDEFCPGVPAGSCAAEVVAPPSTVCRGPAGVCDAAENCSGTPGVTCPADAKQPASTPCRAAVDACDLAEVCNGSSDTCPADVLAPDNTPCSDGMFCNGGETCQSGSCTDQADPCSVSGICNEGTDMCQTNVCPAVPEACRTAQKSILLVKKKDDPSKDKLIWKFIKGDATTQADFENPTSTADYALCIYEGVSQTLAASLHVPPGSNWTPVSTKGYKYLDASTASSGVQKVILKGTGVAGKTKALLKAKGAGIDNPLDMGALQEPVLAQLFNYETGICWQGSYAVAKKNTANLYKAKQ